MINGTSSRDPRPHPQLSSIRSSSPQSMLGKPLVTLTTRRTVPLFSFSPQNGQHIIHCIRSLEIYVNNSHERRRLEEISTILPKLLALREITLNHGASTHL